LNVVDLVPEEDVMTVVEDEAFALVIAEAGMINDNATVAINNNLRFEFLSLSNLVNLVTSLSKCLRTFYANKVSF
jgi:hypothetical protein